MWLLILASKSSALKIRGPLREFSIQVCLDSMSWNHRKESSKSTFTEFIYACHFLWGKFILQAAGKIRDPKLASFYCLVLTL